jgi:hypothetical protein
MGGDPGWKGLEDDDRDNRMQKVKVILPSRLTNFNCNQYARMNH